LKAVSGEDWDHQDIKPILLAHVRAKGAVEPGVGTDTGFGISPAPNHGTIWPAMATA
jgi:hypothetical protein